MNPILFGWLWMIPGLLLGAWMGLHFHKPDWLGGYASWERRMLRLAHVASIALGALNVLHGLRPLGGTAGSALLVAAAVTMPLACLASAWRPRLRALFPVPVAALVGAVALAAAGGLS